MAKKKKSSKKKFTIPKEVKGLLNKYKDTLIMHMLSLLEAKGKNILEALKNIGHIRQKIRKYFISLELMFFGVLFILFGIAMYLPKIWPNLVFGANYMLLGLVLLIIGWIYKKT